MSKKMRNCCFTGFKESEYEFDESKMKYLIIGKETCPSTNRKHWQGYVEFKNPYTLNSIKKLFKDDKIHVEARKGSARQASDYCKKEGNFKEYGSISKQGERTDLDRLKDEILTEGLKVDDIVIDNPTMYHQYGRTLHKIEDLKMRKIFRTEQTKGIWYWGETGVGKSHKAFEGYTPDTHYVWQYEQSGWQDGYCQQETVIMNEFRGQVKYSELLELLDKWPYSVKRRHREPMPFTSKLIIITSSMHPKDIYTNIDAKDSLKQLYRRCEIIEITKPELVS